MKKALTVEKPPEQQRPVVLSHLSRPRRRVKGPRGSKDSPVRQAGNDADGVDAEGTEDATSKRKADETKMDVQNDSTAQSLIGPRQPVVSGAPGPLVRSVGPAWNATAASVLCSATGVSWWLAVKGIGIGADP
eukprot:s3774_g2.t1